ncbi:glycosyltransferase family 2 protein [Rubellimicrobium aerolatum]|uniref:Glycosyltransferase family 2 protein n=1 Tax=Rubellimicrobium aerolatum TaxID=490979 RepID=A0ABW0S9G4_9RHOB|nr:glycosyltransferase family 2 protein [Rubellimicrobium aerolatum]MBP1804921.1 GT2 family glycosyltransferase [Rubellimicrobium aerolatum]
MTLPQLGVVLVTFNSADVIFDCLESLLASRGVRLAITVVDNASTDGTPALIRAWAAGATPYEAPGDIPFPLAAAPKPLPLLAEGDPLPAEGHAITLIETGVNGGFAAGVNRGLAHLARNRDLGRFWVLNPDSAVPPDSPRAFATTPGGFGLLGGRVLYLDKPDVIQIDGGLVNRRTGVTDNSGLFQSHRDTPPPDPGRLDFITGASMVVSREFYEAVGPMREDYFLYYEEVDWALRRGRLPLAYCAEGLVYHRAGTAIGSPTIGRPASPFSLYFKHRGRILFLKRFFPGSVPTGLAFSLAKAGQIAAKGYRAEAWAILAGSFNLRPPASVAARLAPEARRLAFGRDLA